MSLTAVTILALLSVSLPGEAEATSPKLLDGESQLPRAFSSPLNVDPKLDCAIKELAWEYAKRLLPKVSVVLPCYE